MPNPMDSNDMERRLGRILKRSVFGFASIAALFAVGIAAGAGVPAGCRNEELVSQELLAVQASTGSEVPGEKVVYLTFDDGPSPTTELVLDVLKEKGVPATFFVIAADNNIQHLSLLERTVAEGHAIGLHSHSHQYSDIYKNDAAFWDDIEALRVAITPYGCGDTKLLRFPGGSTNTVSHRYGGSNIMESLKAEAVERGYRYFDWNVCANDALGGHPSANEIYSNVIRDADDHNECVVLMHDTAATKNTAVALPQIIDWFQNAGYRFDTLDHKP